MGYIYLLSTNNEIGEVFKLGVTKNNPHDRVKSLQTGSSEKITLLNVYKTDNYFKVEKMLHRKYHKEKKNGEWFILTNDQVMSFTDDCTKADTTITFLKENNTFYN